MARTGRPKSENVKKKVLSIRVEDPMYKRICDYARKHKMTVTDLLGLILCFFIMVTTIYVGVFISHLLIYTITIK